MLSSVLALALVLGNPVQITQPKDGRFFLTWGHADPSNAKDLIACGERDTPDNNHYSAVFASGDGGAHWRRTLIDTSSQWVSEDSCAFGNDGEAYFATGASYVHNGMLHHESGSLHVFRSANRGLTWQGPSVRGFVDWTSIAVDGTHGPYRGYVYLFGNGTSVVRGAWSPLRPILRTSRDGGVTFSDPVSPHPTGFRYHSGFADGSVVLSDGTALVAYAIQRSDHNIDGTAGRHSTIEVMTSSDGGRSMQTRAVLADAGDGFAWPSAPVEDGSQGSHRGRLYVAWIQSDKSATYVKLATSDDRGYHWNVRTVLQGAPLELASACETPHSRGVFINGVNLAINRDGILGLSWSENVGHAMRFAISRDGGKTFDPSVQIAGCTGNPERNIGLDLQAVPFSEDEVALSKAILANKPTRHPDANKLGMSLRIEEEAAVAPYLAADTSGVFHAFWRQPGQGLSFWTRTIRVSKNATSAIADPDITSSVSFEFGRLRYDAASKTFSAEVQLINKGTQTIFEPVRLEGYGIHSNYGRAVPLHPTSLAANGDPVWDVSSVIPANGLLPDTMSRPFHIAFKIEGFRFIPEGDAVSLNFLAYGSLKKN